MDPVLIAAIATLGGALVLGVRLVLPQLKRSSVQSSQGITHAKERMVRSTTKLVEKRSGGGLQTKLEKSGSQLRSGEWVLLVVAFTVVFAGLAFVLGGAIGGGIVLLMVPIAARALLARNINRRQEAFADQLPDLLQNLSSALRSGQSLPQSIAAIAPDLDAPAGDELRRVVIENRIGRDLIESFNDLAARMGSVDFDWVVRAVEINYKTGGDLSVILRRLDSTIRARNHVAGTVRSLSAEGRISGLVLSALPPLLMLAVQFLNPGFLDPLFTTSIGQLLLGVAVVQMIVGSIWLSRMARFKF